MEPRGPARRTSATTRSELEVVVDRTAAAFAVLVRAVPALAERRSRPPRHVRRRHPQAALRARHGLRRPLLPADPPDRPPQPQGPQQQPARPARRPGLALRHRRGGRRPRRPTPGTRHLRGFRAAGRGRGRARAGDRARLRDPVLAGPSLDPRASRMVRLAAPTARSATPRTRPRSTRTSSTSRSTAKGAFPGLWTGACATSCCSGSRKGVRTFRVDNPHTKPLPFWEWLIREVAGPHPDVDLPVGGVHPAEDDEAFGQGWGSPSPTATSPGATRRPS